MSIKIANRRDGAPGYYIGRPSPLGNPFKIGKDGTREEVIESYRKWLVAAMLKRGNVLRELQYLADYYARYGSLTLVCWCSPLPCHGDIIKEKIIAILEQEKNPVFP